MAFEYSGMGYTATVGRFPNGEIAEVFIDNSKIGSAVAHLAQDVAVLISIALQYGVPVDVMAAAMGRDGSGPHSVAGAALDLLISEIEVSP